MDKARNHKILQAKGLLLAIHLHSPTVRAASSPWTEIVIQERLNKEVITESKATEERLVVALKSA